MNDVRAETGAAVSLSEALPIMGSAVPLLRRVAEAGADKSTDAAAAARWLAGLDVALVMALACVAEANAFAATLNLSGQKKTPAGVASTSGAMTNIDGNNADGPDCRP
jgi:hypothetical protein